MERAIIIDKVNKTLDEVTGDKRERKLTERLKEDCGLDSLSMVNLIVSLEEGFGILFNESDLDPEAVLMISDVVELIGRYL